MKKLFLLPYYPNYVKYAALLVALAGMFLAYFLNPEFQSLFYLGLFLIISSREKIETEHVRRVRAEVFRTVFELTMVLGIALMLTELLSDWDLVISPFLYIGLPLLLYLLLYYFILSFRVHVSSEDQIDEKYEINRKSFRFWFTLIFIMFILTVLYVFYMI